MDKEKRKEDLAELAEKVVTLMNEIHDASHIHNGDTEPEAFLLEAYHLLGQASCKLALTHAAINRLED